MDTFHSITDADWEKALRRARSETNAIMEKLQMKLRPKNPTPGINPDPAQQKLEWRDEVQPPPHRWGAYWLHPDGWYRLYEPDKPSAVQPSPVVDGRSSIGIKNPMDGGKDSG